jgi:2-desacetyl-2-hydroxyethyl bacteriochlorophyllide A dehydrogenase
MPRELIATAPRTPSLREYDDGPVRDGHVRIETEFGAPKHGTEMTMYRAVRGQNFPIGLGNMAVGRITELGDGVDGLALGQRIAGYGPLRQTHTWRADRALTMPDSMTWQDAVCYDAAHFALAGVRDARLRAGDHVAVSGLGSLGQMAAQFARVSGAATVTVIDPIAARREVAIRAGADAGIDPTTEDVPTRLRDIAGGRDVDIIIETSGVVSALNTALMALAYSGTVAYLGWAKAFPAGLDLGERAHTEVPDIIFSRACSEPNRDHPRWDFQRIMDTCWDWLSAGKFACEGIISPVVDFADVVEAYRDIDNHPEKSIKLGVRF